MPKVPLFSAQQIQLMKGLGCDFESGPYLALEGIAKLHSAAIPMVTKDDFAAWLRNAEVLIANGVRPSLLKDPCVCIELMSNNVLAELREAGIPGIDINALMHALRAAAGLHVNSQLPGDSNSPQTIKSITKSRVRMSSKLMTFVEDAFGEKLANLDAYKAALVSDV